MKNDEKAYEQVREVNVMPEGTLRYERCVDCQYGTWESDKDMVWCKKWRKYFKAGDGCTGSRDQEK